MGVLDEVFSGLQGFEWDAGNSAKNWRRHQVGQAEAEQALLNRPLVVAADITHSQKEPRFIALGQTEAGRDLTVVFTVRGKHLRVISARPMSKVERKSYGQAQAKSEADS